MNYIYVVLLSVVVHGVIESYNTTLLRKATQLLMGGLTEGKRAYLTELLVTYQAHPDDPQVTEELTYALGVCGQELVCKANQLIMSGGLSAGKRQYLTELLAAYQAHPNDPRIIEEFAYALGVGGRAVDVHMFRIATRAGIDGSLWDDEMSEKIEQYTRELALQKTTITELQREIAQLHTVLDEVRDDDVAVPQAARPPRKKIVR